MKGEFYKMDYEAWDEGTDGLSLEQEAAYLRLCHQMYRRKSSIPSSPLTLGRIWRCHPNKARKLLADLVAAGKVTDRDGQLTNGRVTRELDDRETRRTQQADAGHTGGTRAQENRRKSLEINNTAEAVASNEKQAKSRREREEKKDTPKAPKGAVSDKVFFRETFWPLYPKREGSNPADPAEASFVKAIRNGANRDDIVAGVRGFVTACRSSEIVGTKFVPMAATWLNQGRWKEHLAASGAPAGETPGAYLDTLTEDRWKAEVRTWKTTLGQWNLAKWTPAPDHPATKVPRHILEGFSIQPRPFQPSLVMGRAA